MRVMTTSEIKTAAEAIVKFFDNMDSRSVASTLTVAIGTFLRQAPSLPTFDQYKETIIQAIDSIPYKEE